MKCMTPRDLSCVNKEFVHFVSLPIRERVRVFGGAEVPGDERAEVVGVDFPLSQERFPRARESPEVVDVEDGLVAERAPGADEKPLVLSAHDDSLRGRVNK